MTTSTPPSNKSVAEQIADLRAVIDNMAASLATMQGNQGQLTVVVNRLQSEKIVVGDDRLAMATSCCSLLLTALKIHCRG
jgi:hypothetical protein